MVDDDHLIRLHACDILEEFGFECLAAPAADMALVLLEANAPSVTLLFTDVQMPGKIDGFALARVAAAHWPHIGIVVASGERSPEADDLPASARFVAKPFSVDVVLRHLTEILPEAQQPDPLREHRRRFSGSGNMSN